MTKFFALFGSVLLFAACTAAPSPSASPTTVVTETSTEEAIVTEEATEDNSPEGRGEALFNESRGGFACATCHYSSEGRLVGPGLAGTVARFDDYGLEGDVAEYLRVSILNPAAFIAPAEPAYPPNIMPTNYGELFSEEEIEQLIAYILSL